MCTPYGENGNHMTSRKKMDLRNILSLAPMYNLFGYLISDGRWPKEFVDTIVRPAPGCRILDIACGTADILNYLDDVDYFGFDTSEDYIIHAKEKFAEKGIFLHQELTTDVVVNLPPFDIVMAKGILHHLDDEEAKLLFSTAKNALKPGGRLITFDGVYTAKQSLIAKKLLDLDRGEYVRTQAAYKNLAAYSFSKVTCAVRTDILRLPYAHCIMTCEN